MEEGQRTGIDFQLLLASFLAIIIGRGGANQHGAFSICSWRRVISENSKHRSEKKRNGKRTDLDAYSVNTRGTPYSMHSRSFYMRAQMLQCSSEKEFFCAVTSSLASAVEKCVRVTIALGSQLNHLPALKHREKLHSLSLNTLLLWPLSNSTLTIK